MKRDRFKSSINVVDFNSFIATVLTTLILQCRLRLSPSSVTSCIVAKRCVLEQKLQLTAYRNSYIRNRLVSKWITLTFV